MAGKQRKKGGGLCGLIFTAIILFIVAALIWSIAQSNNIRSVTDVMDFFRGSSDSVEECVSGECELGITESGNGEETEEGQETTEAEQAIIALADIETVDGDGDFENDEWARWSGTPCTTRDEVMSERGDDVESNDETCSAESGVWTNEYTGDEISEPNEVALDHIVPLEWASSHGGEDWEQDSKEEFANDHDNLSITTAGVVEDKDSSGPSSWMPGTDDDCDYAITWVSVLDDYELGIADSDREALESTLADCE